MHYQDAKEKDLGSCFLLLQSKLLELTLDSCSNMNYILLAQSREPTSSLREGEGKKIESPARFEAEMFRKLSIVKGGYEFSLTPLL